MKIVAISLVLVCFLNDLAQWGVIADSQYDQIMVPSDSTKIAQMLDENSADIRKKAGKIVAIFKNKNLMNFTLFRCYSIGTSK